MGKKPCPDEHASLEQAAPWQPSVFSHYWVGTSCSSGLGSFSHFSTSEAMRISSQKLSCQPFSNSHRWREPYPRSCILSRNIPYWMHTGWAVGMQMTVLWRPRPQSNPTWRVRAQLLCRLAGTQAVTLPLLARILLLSRCLPQITSLIRFLCSNLCFPGTTR